MLLFFKHPTNLAEKKKSIIYILNVYRKNIYSYFCQMLSKEKVKDDSMQDISQRLYELYEMLEINKMFMLRKQ